MAGKTLVQLQHANGRKDGEVGCVLMGQRRWSLHEAASLGGLGEAIQEAVTATSRLEKHSPLESRSFGKAEMSDGDDWAAENDGGEVGW